MYMHVHVHLDFSLHAQYMHVHTFRVFVVQLRDTGHGEGGFPPDLLHSEATESDDDEGVVRGGVGPRRHLLYVGSGSHTT